MHKQRTSDEVSFGQLVGSYRTLRTRHSQRAFASFLGITEIAYRNWEIDRNKPEAKNLQRLLEVFLEQGIFTAGKEVTEAQDLWKASKVNVVFDEVWTNALTNVRKLKQEKQGPVDVPLPQPSKMASLAEVAQLDHLIELSDQTLLTKSALLSETNRDTVQISISPSEPHREIALYSVDTNSQKEDVSPFPDVHIEGTMEDHQDSEGEGMDKERRKATTHGIVLVGTIALTGHQALLTSAQRVLRQPSSGPSNKELKDLEEKIRGYWLDYYGATTAPANLMLHVATYAQDVTLLLNRSLLPSTRMRLCACLSQGMLLVGVNCYALGQFQTARQYYQIAQEAAYEANNNILQAEAWYWDSFSWMRSNELGRYRYALDSMLKASHFASLESDLAVQGVTLAGSAEVYGYLKDKAACIQALKRVSTLGGYGHGDYYHIHQFDDAHLNGFRGICLQQFDQSNDPDRYTLFDEAGQAMQEALSQLGAVSLQRAFYVADMAQLQARKGEVESACGHAKQVIPFAGTSASVRHKLATARTLLEPYAETSAVRDLDREIVVVLLQRPMQ